MKYICTWTCTESQDKIYSTFHMAVVCVAAWAFFLFTKISSTKLENITLRNSVHAKNRMEVSIEFKFPFLKAIWSKSPMCFRE